MAIIRWVIGVYDSPLVDEKYWHVLYLVWTILTKKKQKIKNACILNFYQPVVHAFV